MGHVYFLQPQQCSPKTNVRICLQTLKSSCYKYLPEDERQGSRSAPDWGRAVCNAGDTWDTPCSEILKFNSASVAHLEHNQSPEIHKNLIFLMLLVQSRHVMGLYRQGAFVTVGCKSVILAEWECDLHQKPLVFIMGRVPRSYFCFPFLYPLLGYPDNYFSHCW